MDLISTLRQKTTDVALLLERYSLPELVYQGATGKPSPVFNSIQDLQIQQQVAAAGGGRAAQAQAASDLSAIRLLNDQDATTANLVNIALVVGAVLLAGWLFLKFYRKVF